MTTPSKQVRSARTMAALFVAAPTAPPPAEAPLAAIPGVRVVIYILYVFWALIIFGLIYAQRRSLKMPPSVLAIAGTRWCSAPADLSALAGLSTPTTRVSVDKRHFAALFSFRFSMTLWHFAVILGLILWRSEDPPEGGLFRTFSFFTVWNYCLQAVTWAVAASASAAALCTPRGPSPLLRIAAHVMLSVCVPMSILVSIVLWGVLFPYEVGHTSPPYRDLNFFSYCMHAINTIAFLTEAYCDRLLLHKGALGPILLWSMIYAVFVSIQNAYTTSGRTSSSRSTRGPLSAGTRRCLPRTSPSTSSSGCSPVARRVFSRRSARSRSCPCSVLCWVYRRAPCLPERSRLLDER